MEVSTHYDADFILQFYGDQIPKISKKKYNDTDHDVNNRRVFVSKSLAACVVLASGQITHALQRDTNSTTVTTSIDEYRIASEVGEYEQVLRKIISELFQVTIEQSVKEKGYTNQSTKILLPLIWDYKRQDELKLALGVNDAQAKVCDNRQNGFRKEGKYTDVCFLVGETQFPAHKVVLAEYSDYFETFFSSDFKDARADAPIPFGDNELTAKVFEVFLTYIYTRTIDFSKLTVEEIIELGNLSKLVLDKKLQALCTSKLLNSINLDSCFQIAQYAACHGEQRLLLLCESFLKKNSALAESLQEEMLANKYSFDQVVAVHDVAEHLHSEALRQMSSTVLISKLSKDTLGELCSTVAKSTSERLKEAFKKEAYTFVTQNTEAMSQDAMKPARKAYKALMTGLAPLPKKKQKVE